LRAFEEIFSQASRRGAAPGPAVNEDGAPAFPPVVSPEVAALLHNLLKFYDQFGERNRSDPRLQREIIKAARSVGDIQQRLGQYAKAEPASRRPLAVCAARPPAPGTEADAVCETAAIRNELGTVLQATGRYPRAESAFRNALTALKGQAARAPASAPCRFELA